MSEEMGKKDEENGRPTSWLTIPYVRGLSEPVARLLRLFAIKVAHKAEPWKWQLCKRIKDPLPVHKRKGVVYSIECNDCDSVYVGETVRLLQIAARNTKDVHDYLQPRSPESQTTP